MKLGTAQNEMKTRVGLRVKADTCLNLTIFQMSGSEATAVLLKIFKNGDGTRVNHSIS